MVEHYFGQTPVTFRNTELAYNNDLAYWADQAGYKAILAEGWDPVLGWKSPHYTYNPAYTDNIALFLKDYRLSDDLAFRFSNRSWAEWPLDAGKYRSWIDNLPGEESLINLFMDFETFGEHQWADTGIFEFFEDFVRKWCADGNNFKKFADALETHQPVGSIDMPQTVTWADSERDLTAWLGNPMQIESIRVLYELEDAMLRSGDTNLIDAWRYLQTSDNFYYMCTKWFSDGDVHAYFSPYTSPYDAFLFFMNSVRDVRWRLLEHSKGSY
ncbi:hypothetical protein B7Z17_04255 [Candidatus Saccharibacteria bacterium 32-49-10]|nr:MAG: hypothetical protein B7Z17_04255 [Candidatus Saccharibacteria bacterium 32-49-10]